ncbi:WD domain, G-beta repeat-containing protein [Besnoitia besnoiti]|uniref:WD domain, G-beta repeat-containing protein n=1 Tax=Besnoitia besnoiti TaxID=94643 RepID=A0A2A9MJU6_BESBE|nr:WD domain, G-beta repeat-containing protein [Besnoitia besnoiti]PFH36236.1 WD domain, G-beta repeat-containing protein [Besnoitia besnoiti]
MSLRERQEEQLHQALLLYLQKRFPETAKVFQDEAKLQGFAGGALTRRCSSLQNAGRVTLAGAAAASQLDEDLLPRRWGATARLQAKVTSLQSQLVQQQEQIALLMAAAAGRAPAEGAAQAAKQAGDLADGKREDDEAAAARAASGEKPEKVDWVLPCAPAVYTLAGPRCPVNALAVHPLLAQLVTASDDGVLRIYHIMQGEGKFERQFKAHSVAINDVVFDASGRWCATASADMAVKVFDVQQNYEPSRTLQGHSDIVSGLQFCSLDESPRDGAGPAGFGRQASNGVLSSASSAFLFSCSRDGTVKLWALASGLCVRTFSPAPQDVFARSGSREAWIRAVAAPEKSMRAAKLFASCGNDQKVCLWRYDLGVVVREMTGHSHVVESAVFASEKMLRLLHAHKQAPPPLPNSLLDEGLLKAAEKESGTLHVLRLCGLVLFSASRDRTLRMWDAVQGVTLKVFVGHDNWVRCVILHPAGSHIVSSGDDRSVRCWNVISGACERVIAPAHSQFVTSLGFDFSSLLLASGSLDCTVKLWSCSHSQHKELANKQLKP